MFAQLAGHRLDDELAGAGENAHQHDADLYGREEAYRVVRQLERTPCTRIS
jgi:hypothetical protein